VAVGVTDCVPVVAVTVPGAGAMETVVAPVTVHCRVEDCPAVIVLGLAVKLVIAGVPVTVTVAEPVTEPETLVAVII
jgi:hypothetical protein